LRCLLDSGAEVSLIDCEVLKCLDQCNYVLDDNKQDIFLSINGSEFVSVGKAAVTLASGKKVPFVVASDLVHKVVLSIDILDNAAVRRWIHSQTRFRRATREKWSWSHVLCL